VVVVGVDGHFPSLTEGKVLQILQPGADGLGLDRLSISFPVGEPDPSGFTSRTVREGGGRSARTYGVTLGGRDGGGASVFVGAAEVPERGWMGKIEANPSRLDDPDGCGLLPLGESLPAAGRMWALALAGTGLQPRSSLESARVRRVDVARDFRGIGRPSFFVRGLLNVRRRHARRSFLYANPQAGNAETLWAGSGTGGCRLYDQHEAYAGKGAPIGAMRWEVEARGGWLDAVGLRSVGDLGDDLALRRLARTRWEWSRMGTEVTGTASVVEAVEGLVCRCPRGEHGRRECGCGRPLTAAKADRLLGQLVREALGVARPVATHTASEYEAVKRRLGIVPSADLFAAEGCARVAGRLDFASGCEVAA
jgi:hypothetical protein